MVPVRCLTLDAGLCNTGWWWALARYRGAGSVGSWLVVSSKSASYEVLVMQRLKLLSLVVIVVAALAGYVVSTASAAGPTLLFLPGEGVPILFNSLPLEPNIVLTELQGELETLHGEGALFEGTMLNLESNAGEYLALYLKVKHGAKNCNTEGDRTGEVLVPKNESRLVYDKLGTGTALVIGVLLLVRKFSIKCESVNITLEGSTLSVVAGTNAEQLVGTTTLLGGIHCAKTSGGIPEERTYWNNAGEEEHPGLKVELGLGEESACMLITLSTTSLRQIDPNKMVEIMG
jgi:hypothetical protein